MKNKQKYFNCLDNISKALSNNYRSIQEIPYSIIKDYSKKSDAYKQSKAKLVPINECIDAATVRTRDIVGYLATKQSTPATFAEFTSIVIQIDNLKSCIETLATAFELDINQKTSNIFQHKKDAITENIEIPNEDKPQLNNSDKAIVSDDHYFKYIRSLCFTHPLETDRHKHFQGGEFEWCRYVDKVSIIHKLRKECNHSDFIAKLGTTRSSKDKSISLYYQEFIAYADHFCSFLPDIEKKINDYVETRNINLRTKILKVSSEFDNYEEYLLYLLVESKKRVDEDGNLESAITLFLINMEDSRKSKLLEEYRFKIKSNIDNWHVNLQNMNKYFDFSSGVIPNLNNHSSYDYFLEKLVYLKHLCESKQGKVDILNIKENIKYIGIRNHTSLKKYLSNPYSEKNLHTLKDTCNDSEWSRALAYKYYTVLSPFIDLDFWASDWNVYWQIQLAFFAIEKENFNMD